MTPSEHCGSLQRQQREGQTVLLLPRVALAVLRDALPVPQNAVWPISDYS